jgi:LemA protein
MRSREFIIIGVVALLLFVSGCAGCNVRNGIIAAEEEVKSEWANVQSAYQRRADLIPNLVRTVERAETFDRSVLESVESVQERVASMNLGDVDARDADRLSEFGAAQREVGASLAKLFDMTSGSSTLRSVEAFRDLQDQIEGSENRINFARRDYNEAVQVYNKKVRRFPTSIVASLSGFGPRPTFEADPGADQPVRVD